MAEIVWTVPALQDLDAIADYIALEHPDAARDLVDNVFKHVGHLAGHPEMGSFPPELEGTRYRQLVTSPVRVFYRYNGEAVHILHAMRCEQQFHAERLERGQ